MDRHNKICNARKEKEFCCWEHFEEMLISNAYTQADYNLDVLELLQQNGAEIPSEILDKMYEIS